MMTLLLLLLMLSLAQDLALRRRLNALKTV